jgi:Domain of unknown function (DUF1707)
MTEVRHDRIPAANAVQVRDEQQPDLRASDADRDRTAARLGGAMAVGQLTSTEYAERLDAAYAARTLGELAPLTRDLPDSDVPEANVETVGRAEVAARFSKVIRSGRWVAGRRTRLTVRFGALIINLAEAVLPGREVTIEVDAFCGKLIIIAPAAAQVIDEGGALFAKRAVYGRGTAEDANGPVIRLVGDARFSKVVVYRRGQDPANVWEHLQRWQEMRHLR